MPADQSAYPLVAVRGICVGTFKTITNADQFPPPIGNIIYLPAGSSWMIDGTVDLLGNRLVLQGNVTIMGTSSETAFLISTGLATSSYLITSSYTVPIRFITLGCPADTFVFNLTGDGTNGLDIFATNFGSATVQCGGLGYIANYTNVILNFSTILKSTGGFTFGGTIGTIGISNCLFSSPVQTGAYLYFPTALTITRRIRILYSSFVVYSQGINLETTSIPNGAFILGTVNFSGPGTYLVNVTSNNIRANFSQTIGVPVSASICEVRIVNNATVTTVASNTWTAIVGTNTDLSLDRFTRTAGVQVQYVGAQTQRFYITAKASMSSGNNVELGITYTVNGLDADLHYSKLTTSGSGEIGILQCDGVDELAPNDVVKIWVKNFTNSNSITVKELVFIIFQINT